MEVQQFNFGLVSPMREISSLFKELETYSRELPNAMFEV